jgi:hypothetical protein
MSTAKWMVFGPVDMAHYKKISPSSEAINENEMLDT